MAAQTRCARYARATRAGGEAALRLRWSRLPVSGRGVPRGELESVPKRGSQHLEPVAAAARRAWQVDDERRSPQARDPTREQGVRGTCESVRPYGLGDAR